MKLRAAAIALLLASVTAAAVAAEPNPFEILNSSGKSIGHAFYSIDKTKNGYKVKAHFEYSIPHDSSQDIGDTRSGNAPQDAQYTFTYTVNQNGDFLSGYTQDTATQILMSFQPDKKRDSMTIGEMQGGTSIGSHPMGTPLPEYLVAPNYDPSAIQILLLTAIAHPHPDSKYSLAVPGRRTGSHSGGDDSFVYVSLSPMPDAAGTLDGKPIALKHFQLHYHEGASDLYADADGNLMQADVAPLHVKFVRKGFALTTP